MSKNVAALEIVWQRDKHRTYSIYVTETDDPNYVVPPNNIPRGIDKSDPKDLFWSAHHAIMGHDE